MSENQPEASRPVNPDGYGIPETVHGVLPWSFVDEEMSLVKNYWVSTTRPDGRPHAMPVWGVWWQRRFYFVGSPLTRRARNLVHNPAVVVHTESGDRVVIMEGEALAVEKPYGDLAVVLSRQFSAKYAFSGYQLGPDQWDEGGLYEKKPGKVFAWTRFPEDTTRWIFLQNENGGK